jgi:superkiller protein 3
MTTPYINQLDNIIALAGEDQKAARKALRRLAPELPETAQVQTALGLTYIALDQPRDAVRTFKLAIELDPEDPMPRYQLGTLQSDMGLLPHAEENLRVAVAADPENVGYQEALGFTYYKANKADLAIAALETAAEKGSKDDDVFASLGYLYYFEEHLSDSRDAFTRAIELNPDFAEVYNNRGYLNILLGKFDDALVDLDTCIAKDDTYLRARFNQAVATWLNGDHDAAMDKYAAARLLDNGDAELSQHLDDLDEISKYHPSDESLKDLKVKLAVAQKTRRR